MGSRVQIGRAGISFNSPHAPSSPWLKRMLRTWRCFTSFNEYHRHLTLKSNQLSRTEEVETCWIFRDWELRICLNVLLSGRTHTDHLVAFEGSLGRQTSSARICLIASYTEAAVCKRCNKYSDRGFFSFPLFGAREKVSGCPLASADAPELDLLIIFKV